MNTARLNITLPEDVVRILSGVKNKSAYIAEAIRERRQIEEKEKMRKKIDATYREAAKEDYETYKEWEDTLKDGLEDDTR